MAGAPQRAANKGQVITVRRETRVTDSLPKSEDGGKSGSEKGRARGRARASAGERGREEASERSRHHSGGAAESVELEAKGEAEGAIDISRPRGEERNKAVNQRLDESVSTT